MERQLAVSDARCNLMKFGAGAEMKRATARPRLLQRRETVWREVNRRSLVARKSERVTPSALAFRLRGNRDVGMPGTRARNRRVFPD